MMIEESYFQHMSEPDLEKCYKWPWHLTYQPFANEFVKETKWPVLAAKCHFYKYGGGRIFSQRV